VIEFAVAGLSDPVQATVPWLSLSILVPIGGALLIPFIPDQGEGKQIRWYALIVTLITFLITVAGYLTGYDPSLSGLQLFERVSWLPEIGPDLDRRSRRAIDAPHPANELHHQPRLLSSLAGDSSNRACSSSCFWPWMAAKSPFLPCKTCCFSSWHGSWNFSRFICYLPSGAAKNANMRPPNSFSTPAGSSLFILLAALAMGFFGGGTPSFEYTALAAKDFGSGFQLLCYAGLLIAFGVKLPIVPLHTWLPDAHGEATAPVHMLLAGILLKMGGYALLRFNCELLPAAHAQFAPLLIVLGVVNIIYAALTSFAQRNLKRKIAYSSISHMGFVLDWHRQLQCSWKQRRDVADDQPWVDRCQPVLPCRSDLRPHPHVAT
jgi:NAD(P)H-quinone oxidoreductase subunit 4